MEGKADEEKKSKFLKPTAFSVIAAGGRVNQCH
jgi:hypothetical protein